MHLLPDSPSAAGSHAVDHTRPAVGSAPTNPETPAPTVKASRAIDIRVAGIAGVGTLLLLPMAIAEAIGQVPAAAPVWTAMTIVLVVATVTTMLAIWMPWRLREVLWRAYPFVWLSASLAWTLWPPAGATPVWQTPWMWLLSAYAAALASLRFRLGTAILITVLPPVAALIAMTATGDAVSGAAASEATLFMGNAWFAVVTKAARAQLLASRRSDETAARSRQDALAAAAWERERIRLAALVHDHLLSTLSAAAQLDDTRDTGIVQAVHRARALSTTVSAERSDARVSGGHFLTRLQETCRPIPVKAAQGRRRSSYPAPVAAAIVAATAEAVGNAVRHSGVTPQDGIVVTAHLSRDSVEVRVTDSGVGFDPDAVPATRLGIRTSIRGQMYAVPGGAGSVNSSPGTGTVVTLTWSPVKPDIEPLPELDESTIAVGVTRGTGVATRSGRAVALASWLGGLVWLAVAWPDLTHRGILLASVAWMLVAIVVVTDRRPVLTRPAILVVASAPLIGGLALVLQENIAISEQVWVAQIGADIVALLAARGLLGWAVAGYVAQLAIVAPYATNTETVVALVIFPASYVACAAILAIAVRRSIVAQFQWDQESARSSAVAAASLDTARRAALWMAQIVGLAEHCLSDLETDGPISARVREDCRAAASAVRDRLRAPGLVSDELSAACAAARARGVRVDLLDDGASGAAPDRTAVSQIAEIIRSLTRGRVVVRIHPPGRRTALSLVVDDGTDVDRIEFATRPSDPSSSA